MRIALVSPKWNQMVNSYPPLGLGYLAAVMEAEGHTVTILDLGLHPDTSLEQDLERLISFQPDLMGVTAMTNNYHSAERILALVKARIGCVTVLGGPHATIFPDRVIADPNIDYVIYGEGEETLRDLTRVIASKAQPDEATLRGIAGLCFKVDGQPTLNPPRPLIRDLDALPMPARHLFELERYPLYTPRGERMVTLLSSRGCPYNCSYCFKGIVGRTYRQRSPESIIAELHHLKDTYGYRHFYFIDDLFTLDRRRLTALTTRMIEEKLDIRWQCLARVDRVTLDLLQLMYRAGCREVHYGIESGNAEILQALGKEITHDQVRRAVAWTAQAGIMAKGYFMLGLPGDTEETMQQTIQFASELELDQAMFSLTTPFPGTRLWDELVARQPDVVFNRDFSQAFYYANYDNPVKPFFNVSQVSDERLTALAAEAQTRFQESKRRRKYVRAFGSAVGQFMYNLSRWRGIRRAAHRLLNTRLLRSLRGATQIGEYDAKKEYSQRWN